jgi:hypothetical protein
VEPVISEASSAIGTLGENGCRAVEGTRLNVGMTFGGADEGEEGDKNALEVVFVEDGGGGGSARVGLPWLRPSPKLAGGETPDVMTSR